MSNNTSEPKSNVSFIVLKRSLELSFTSCIITDCLCAVWVCMQQNIFHVCVFVCLPSPFTHQRLTCQWATRFYGPTAGRSPICLCLLSPRHCPFYVLSWHLSHTWPSLWSISLWIGFTVGNFTSSECVRLMLLTVLYSLRRHCVPKCAILQEFAFCILYSTVMMIHLLFQRTLRLCAFLLALLKYLLTNCTTNGGSWKI